MSFNYVKKDIYIFKFLMQNGHKLVFLLYTMYLRYKLYLICILMCFWGNIEWTNKCNNGSNN